MCQHYRESIRYLSRENNYKMKNPLSRFIFLGLLFFSVYSCERLEEVPQEEIDLCTSTENIISFNLGPKNYELMKELSTWKLAAACAVNKGGYLVEINSEAEQIGIFNAVSTNISDFGVLAADGGGGASYIWIGANNFVLEKRWVWDGDGDHKGENFWFGSSDGVPVNGLYNNWGVNPDISTDHNGVAMALTPWDKGEGGNWNDIRQHNKLFFVIEYD